MKFRSLPSGLARSLVALSVSLAVVLSSHAFAISSFARTEQPDSPQSEFRIVAADATVLAAGVMIQWRTNAAADNLGFNVYRLHGGQRTLVNHALVPGAGFVSPAAQALMRGGYSYSCFDRGGTADFTYYIESVSLLGNKKIHDAISPSKTASEFGQTPETLAAANASTSQATDSFENYFPVAEDQINSPVGALDDQWAIAGQAGLKIGIKKDGWYRITKVQMAAAGFDPTVEIRNLRLFVDAQEIAINTSHQSGPFASGDYIEFFGRGLDLATTDTRTYYLIAGTTPGKRVRGQNELDEPPVILAPPAATPTPVPVSSPPRLPPAPLPPSPRPVLRDQIFRSAMPSDPNGWFGSIWLGSPSNRETKENTNTRAVIRQPEVARAYDSPPESFQPEASQPDRSQPHVSRGSQPVASDLPEVTELRPATEKAGKKQDFANAAGGTINTTAPKAKTSSRATSRRRSLRKRAHSKNRKRRETPKNLKLERNHPMLSAASAAASFDFTAERKDRTVYFSSLLNGDVENYFGQVVADPGNPLNQTLFTPNPDLTTAGPAKLEVAMQGVNFVYHQVEVKFNGVSLGMVLPPPPGNVFFGQSHAIASFDVPVSLLRTANTLTFTPQAGDTTIVDYTRLTYRHQFLYDNAIGNIHLGSLPGEGDTLTVGSKTYTFKGSPSTDLEIGIGVDKQTTATNIANRINTDSAATLCTAVSWAADVNLSANTGGITGNSITLIVDGIHLTKTLAVDPGAQKFSLRGTQSAKVDGFTTPSVLLIDYTDPEAVSISRPISEPSAFGFAINVPLGDPPAKAPRLLYAVPEGQFKQPASLTLNQASSLNSNAADFLIVSYKDFIPSVEPLRLARANQGFTAKVVDVEDVYDEFSYGKHGPQAIKDFLAHALAQWTTKPRYVVFVGDATYDPRNYFNFGNYDLVPTKLVDATYNETVSDDWLADIQVDPFSQETDDIADVPVGRIPVRTVAEADLIVSKIVNYVPPPEPQAALLVADNPGTPPVWDFESGNDNVQALLPANMTVQRVNVRTEPSIAVATANIAAGINEGRALVNYSGHGNVNVWGSSSIFLNANAMALTNGMNKLTFVVVMDCLNGYFQDPGLQSLSESFLKAPNGGAVGAFASSGLTTTFGQRQMELELYRQLYGGQSIAMGDAVKIAKAESGDRDVRATWILFGDPTIKIR